MSSSKQPYRNGKSVFIIAEIGTAHNGSTAKAQDLIHAARDAGADCVKFQYVIADEIVHPKTGKVTLPGGYISLYRRFQELEQPPEFYHKIKETAEISGLTFLCSPFGTESAQELIRMEVPAIKIASPELNHYPLLNTVKDFPLIMSTGVSTLEDIAKAVSLTKDDSMLLHCITSYPAPEKEYNLKVIQTLRSIFGRETGVSDHSRDPVLVPALAAALKASAIEKHITLSAADGGLDDPIALEPNDFSLMCKSVRLAEAEGYNGTLERLVRAYDPGLIVQILGDGVKRLATSEAANYFTTNRSIISTRTIAKGEEFTSENVALLRSEKNITPGLPPDYLDIVLGHRASRDIENGRGITRDSM